MISNRHLVALVLALGCGLVQAQAPAQAAAAVPVSGCAKGEGAPAIASAHIEQSGPLASGNQPLPTLRRDQRLTLQLSQAAYTQVVATQTPVLYLDSMPLLGLKPVAMSAVDCSLTFPLTRTPEAAAQWMVIDKVKRLDGHATPLPMRIGLGPNGNGEVAVLGATRLPIEVRDPNANAWFFGGLAVLALVLIPTLRRHSGLLRDQGTAEQLAALNGPPTFSLSRTQFLLWFLFAMVATLYLWAVTGTLPALSGTLLSILFVSGGTAVAAPLIDDMKAAKLSPSTGSFWRDILEETRSEPPQASLHRLQQVVVTLLLLGAGGVSVYHALTFPEFDDKWILLMGLSTGTYLLGKRGG